MTYDPGSNTAHDMDMTRRVHHPNTVRTVSGRYINVFDPDPAEISIEDIAHGLSMICRYGGHTRKHYSVGEHSLNVSVQLERMYGEPALSLAGLLHDASEAYLGDVVRPLKHNDTMALYRNVEAKFEDVLAVAFDLREAAADPRVKQIDNEILPWEMAMCRDSRVRVSPAPEVVRGVFLQTFHRLNIAMLEARG